MDKLICIEYQKYRICLESENRECYSIIVDLEVDNKLVAFKTYKAYTLLESLSDFINVCRLFKLNLFDEDSVLISLEESILTRDDLVKMINTVYTVAHDKRHIEIEKALEEVNSL